MKEPSLPSDLDIVSGELSPLESASIFVVEGLCEEKTMHIAPKHILQIFFTSSASSTGEHMVPSLSFWKSAEMLHFSNAASIFSKNSLFRA